MKTKLLVIIGLAVMVTLLGVTGCSAADLKALEGVLQNADSLSGNVTVTLNNGETVTFNLEDVDLEEILAASDNVGLEIGDQLRLRVHDDGEVSQVQFRNTHINGVIKDITAATANATSGTVTITTEDDEDITLTVDEKTLVVVYATGRAAIADLEVGQEVYVRYDTATMVAEKIRVGNDGPAWQNRYQEKEQHQSNNGGPGNYKNQNQEDNQYGLAVQKGKAGHGK